MADINELRRRMEGAINTLKNEFAGLRTGRASPNLLDGISVDAYGSMMPLNQVANISVPEPRLITISVWDKSMVKAVEKAIQISGLGLNPSSDGQLVRVPLPELSQERRQELVKISGQKAEGTRIAIRNIRRDGMDFVKKQEKDGKISKDDLERQEGAIQKLTDEFIKKVDDQFAAKEKDIMQV